MPGYVIEALAAHERASFACGAEPLDRYFRQQVSQDVKRLVASCFVLVETESRMVAGYYTLAATSVLASELPMDVLKRLPRYPLLPAGLLGRLAVDRRFHRRGFGDALVADAARRAFRSDTKAFALVVDAKDANAVAFYVRLGFRPFDSRSMAMFLPLSTARKAGTGEEST